MIEFGWCFKGVERRWRWDFPFQAFGRFPRALGRWFALAAHGGQHNEEEEKQN